MEFIPAGKGLIDFGAWVHEGTAAFQIIGMPLATTSAGEMQDALQIVTAIRFLGLQPQNNGMLRIVADKAFWMPKANGIYRFEETNAAAWMIYRVKEQAVEVQADPGYVGNGKAWKVIGGLAGQKYRLEFSTNGILWQKDPIHPIQTVLTQPYTFQSPTNRLYRAVMF